MISVAALITLTVLFGDNEPYQDGIPCVDCDQPVVYRMWKNRTSFPVAGRWWSLLGFTVLDFDHDQAYELVEMHGYGDTWQRLPNYASKADLFRLVALYHYGGWYADADMKPQPLLQRLAAKYHVVIFNGACGWMAINKLKYNLGLSTVTHAPQFRCEIFAAPKQWPPLLTALTTLRANSNITRPWTVANQIDFSGPGLFTDSILQHEEEYPKANVIKCSKQGVYFRHLRLHSWHPN